MIHIISFANRHLYEDVLEEHFRLRHDIFVEERRWETLRKPDRREIDSFDNEDTIYLLALEGRRVVGGHRLYPTTKPSMMSEIFPHLADVRGCPSDPLIWEWSRYFIIRDRRDGNLNLRLMAAVQEFCLAEGIAKISAIMETWWLPRFQEAGFKVTPLGLPGLVEDA
jgi:acyl-homoserine lactone synthase